MLIVVYSDWLNPVPELDVVVILSALAHSLLQQAQK